MSISVLSQCRNADQIHVVLISAFIMAVLWEMLRRAIGTTLPALLSFLASTFAIGFFSLLFVSALCVLAFLHV